LQSNGLEARSSEGFDDGIIAVGRGEGAWDDEDEGFGHLEVWGLELVSWSLVEL
jgi:hypothetical protein